MAMTNVYTGSNGTLTLADEATPEGQDAKAVQEAYELQTVGRLTRVEVRVRTDLEEFHECGRRHATSLHPGNVYISGQVSRAYVNGALLFLLLGRGASGNNIAEPYVQPTFNISLPLNDRAVPGNTATLELTGVKFANWNYLMPEDDFVLENLAFKALTISIVDKEAPAAGGEATAKTVTFPETSTA
jgi:hypothetical protein